MLELESGFIEFKLDYSATDNIPADGFIASDIFTAGGHNWQIYCYPHGSLNDTPINGQYMSLYIRLLNGSKPVKTIIEAFIIRNNGKPSQMYRSRFVRVFCPDKVTRNMSGWDVFATRSYLESDCVVDGWITIMCGVIVLRENSNPGNPIVVPSSDIQSHFGSLLQSADGTDVSFCVKGEMFHAHRAVLAARSPVFRAELLGPMAEAQMSCITLDDIEAPVFEILLQFIYKDTLPEDDKLGDSSPDMFQHLLAAADRYALNRLKLICAQKLWENMSADIVASVLTCAEMYNCPELRSRCIDFVVAEDNFKKVVLTQNFMQLGQRFPLIIAELKQRVGA